MSHKETCPGCGVYTSGVYLAMMRDEPCPHCGASLLDGSPPVAAPTLTEFLLARIAEDERHARKLAETDQRPVLALAVTANHPQRILAECEAKRRIVELHRAPEQRPDGLWRNDTDMCTTFEPWPCTTLRALALPYADHDDYDESWRP